MEKERLIFSIGRFDHYFDSVNNKIAAYIALNTFLVGGIVAGFIAVQEHICIYLELLNTLLTIIVLLGIINLIISIRASTPYLNGDTQSVFYFGSVGKMKYEEFTEISSKMKEKEEIEDLRNQAYNLSRGLNKKFRRLRWSGNLLLIQFIILIPIIIILLINKF